MNGEAWLLIIKRKKCENYYWNTDRTGDRMQVSGLDEADNRGGAGMIYPETLLK